MNLSRILKTIFLVEFVQGLILATKELFKKFNLKDKKYIFYPAQFWAHKNHKYIMIRMIWNSSRTESGCCRERGREISRSGTLGFGVRCGGGARAWAGAISLRAVLIARPRAVRDSATRQTTFLLDARS